MDEQTVHIDAHGLSNQQANGRHTTKQRRSTSHCLAINESEGDVEKSACQIQASQSRLCRLLAKGTRRINTLLQTNSQNEESRRIKEEDVRQVCDHGHGNGSQYSSFSVFKGEIVG